MAVILLFDFWLCELDFLALQREVGTPATPPYHSIGNVCACAGKVKDINLQQFFFQMLCDSISMDRKI